MLRHNIIKRGQDICKIALAVQPWFSLNSLASLSRLTGTNIMIPVRSSQHELAFLKNSNNKIKFGFTRDNQQENRNFFNFRFSPYTLYWVTVGAFLAGQTAYNYFYDKNHTLTYNEFMQNILEKSEVTKIEIQNPKPGGANPLFTVKIFTKTLGTKTLFVANVDHFLQRLEQYQYSKTIQEKDFIPVQFIPTSRFPMILTLASGLLVVSLLYDFTKSHSSSIKRAPPPSDMLKLTRSPGKLFQLTPKSTNFKDIAGMFSAKQEVSELVDFLKHSKKYHDLGARIPKGALLSGPAGCGKTMLARACAGEANVPFYFVSGADFVEMFVGVGASRVRDLFRQARARAPAIVFIDEIDAIGRKREVKLGGNDERDNTLNQLLVEMDGFQREERVVVIGATNRKELLDPALVRPGRFDRIIEITAPDLQERKEIFMVHLKIIKTQEQKDDLAKRLATLTPGFTGADIANICNEAAILAARQDVDQVDRKHFEEACERVIAGLPKRQLDSIEERELVALHEAGHAVVSWFLPGGMPVLKISVIPRTKGSLGFTQYLGNDNTLIERGEIMDQLASALAGRVAEQEFKQQVFHHFNGNQRQMTTGAWDDLNKTYDLANSYVTKFGMSDKIGLRTLERRYSEQTQREIDEEIKRLIDEAALKAKTIICEHRQQIQKLADRLIQKGTMDLLEIIEILGERPYEYKSNQKAYLEIKKEKQDFKDKLSGGQKNKQEMEIEEEEEEEEEGPGESEKK